MDLFLSTFENKIDRKGRLSVPAKYRLVFDRSNSPLFLFKSLKSTLKEVNLFSHHGRLVNIKDFKDTPTLLFFGFTHCPEVCPTTLSNLLNNIELLEKNKKNYRVLFVTLDPERDTINNLKDYLQNFNSSVIGLTGELNEINKFARIWNIYWEKVSEGDDYTISHTATVFMINKNGKFAGTIAWGESDESIKLK